MDAADEAPQPFQRVGILQLGRAAAAPGIERKAEPGVVMQRRAVDLERRHDGNFALRQLAREVVFLQDLLVRPARRAVELGHQETRVAQGPALVLLEPHLVDAVFVAVERELAAVGEKARALHGVEHDVGREACVGRDMFGVVHPCIVRPPPIGLDAPQHCTRVVRGCDDGMCDACGAQCMACLLLVTGNPDRSSVHAFDHAHPASPVATHDGRPGDASAWLDADEAAALWGAVLDGGLPDLELGALLAVLSLTGESPEELLGLHHALAARCERFAPDLARRAIAIPAYGLVPGEASLAVLLALFLRRFDVPVVLHGTLDSPAGPSVPALLRELGVLPSASLADAERELARLGRRLHAGAAVLARTGDGAVVAHAPGNARTRRISPPTRWTRAAMGALRLAMGVHGSPSARLAGLLAGDGRRGVIAFMARGRIAGRPVVPPADHA